MILRYASLVLFAFLVSCVSTSKPPAKVRDDDRKKIDAELSQEMSLKADRSQLQDLRKDIPEDKQKSNDELALFLQMMSQGKENPSTVRDRFSSLVQRKRADFRKKVDRLREDFRQEETKRREDFMSAQRTKREAFLSRKRDYKEASRFNTDQERERTRFFADERDRRSSFEAELNTHSKDFDSYMRERQNQFNEQFRLYSKQMSEKPKDSKAVTGDDFKRLQEAPATPLGTEE
jgi:hypothetical protein